MPHAFGVWRSPVARFNGVEEVQSSNLCTPTGRRPCFCRAFVFFRANAQPVVWTNRRAEASEHPKTGGV